MYYIFRLFLQKRSYIFFTLAGLVYTSNCLSQRDMGHWSLLINNLRVSEHWGVHTNLQMRHNDGDFHFDQLLARAGLRYYMNDKWQIWVGMDYFKLNPLDAERSGVYPADVFSWQQLIYEWEWKRLDIEHRFWLEQRLTESNAWKYRLRNRLTVDLPLNKPEIQKGTLYVSVWTENFLDNRAPLFNRQTLLTTLAYRLNSISTFRIGYFSQFIGGGAYFDALHFSLINDLRLKKKA